MYALIGFGTAIAAVAKPCRNDPTNVDISGKVWPEKVPVWFAMGVAFLMWPAIAAFIIVEKTDI